MRQTIHFVASLAAAAAFAATPALAECKRFGFTVNDYGKDGPTKDAKDLLDKLITKTMADKGVKDYSTGKKSVSCELFLNFIVFDEHTCTAEASVCWGGTALPGSEQSDAADDTAAKTKSASDEGAAAPKATKKKKKDAVAAVTKPDAAEAKPVSDTALNEKSSTDNPSAEKTPAPEKAAAVQHHKKSTINQVADPKPAAKPAVKEAAKTPESSDASPSPATPQLSDTQAATDSSAKPTSDVKPETAKADDAPSTPKSEPVKAEDVGTIPQSHTASANDDGTAKKSPEKSSEKSAKAPVVTGSISEPAKKPAKHKTEKAPASSDDGKAADTAGKSSDNGDGGYPTPLPPQPGDIPAQ